MNKDIDEINKNRSIKIFALIFVGLSLCAGVLIGLFAPRYIPPIDEPDEPKTGHGYYYISIQSSLEWYNPDAPSDIVGCKVKGTALIFEDGILTHNITIPYGYKVWLDFPIENDSTYDVWFWVSGHYSIWKTYTIYNNNTWFPEENTCIGNVVMPRRGGLTGSITAASTYHSGIYHILMTGTVRSPLPASSGMNYWVGFKQFGASWYDPFSNSSILGAVVTINSQQNFTMEDTSWHYIQNNGSHYYIKVFHYIVSYSLKWQITSTTKNNFTIGFFDIQRKDWIDAGNVPNIFDCWSYMFRQVQVT